MNGLLGFCHFFLLLCFSPSLRLIFNCCCCFYTPSFWVLIWGNKDRARYIRSPGTLAGVLYLFYLFAGLKRLALLCLFTSLSSAYNRRYSGHWGIFNPRKPALGHLGYSNLRLPRSVCDMTLDLNPPEIERGIGMLLVVTGRDYSIEGRPINCILMSPG